jgi:hypothetical protein
MPFLGLIDDRIRRREDRLGRSIVTIESDNAGRWGELLREVENIAYGCGAERVDRLRVIADDS